MGDGPTQFHKEGLSNGTQRPKARPKTHGTLLNARRAAEWKKRVRDPKTKSLRARESKPPIHHRRGSLFFFPLLISIRFSHRTSYAFADSQIHRALFLHCGYRFTLTFTSLVLVVFAKFARSTERFLLLRSDPDSRRRFACRVVRNCFMR